MVIKRILFSLLLVSFGLILFSLEYSNYTERLFNNPSVGDSIKILKEGLDRGELKPFDYLILYYLLKAKGERESAIYYAFEGFQKVEEEDSALLLLDVLNRELFFNNETKRLALELFEKNKEKFDSPLYRFSILNSLLLINWREEVLEKDKYLNEMGIPQYYFFNVIEKELPRLRFKEIEDYSAYMKELKFIKRAGISLKIPTYLIDTKREFLSLYVVPFEVDEATDINIILLSRSSLKVFVDNKKILTKDEFEEIGCPVRILKIHCEKGKHILSLIYFVSSPGEGFNLAFMEEKKGKIRFLKEVPLEVAETEFIEQKPLIKVKDDNLKELVLGLFYQSINDYGIAQVNFEKVEKKLNECAFAKVILANYYFERNGEYPFQFRFSKCGKIIDEIINFDEDVPEAKYYKAVMKSFTNEDENILLDLKELTQKYTKDPRWFVELYNKLSDLGLMGEAKNVLMEVFELFPENERIQNLVYSFYENTQNYEKRFEFLNKYFSKRADKISEFTDYYIDIEDFDRAISSLKKEKELFPELDVNYDIMLLELLMKQKKFEEALKLVDNLLKINPKSIEFLEKKANILIELNRKEEAYKIYEEVKKQNPSFFTYDRAMWLKGGNLPFEGERISFEEAIKGFIDNPDGASSAFILDHQITQILEDGGAIERYHGILKIYDKEGVEKEGELSFPSDYLLVLRVVKPDGRVVEPEYIPTKRTIGMSGLEPNDIIEYEYVNTVEPNEYKNNSYYRPNYQFIFQDLEKPFFRTLWTIKYPKSFKMEFYEQNLKEKPEEYESQGVIIRKYDYRNANRISEEPLAPPTSYFLPLVYIVGNFTWEDLFRVYKNAVIGFFPVSEVIKEEARKRRMNLKRKSEIVEDLINFVLTEIDMSKSFDSLNPTHTLLMGEGNRLQLFGSLLKANDIDFDILFVEDKVMSNIKNNLPLDRYNNMLLRVKTENGEEYIFLSDSTRNPKILPINLAGSRAISLSKDHYEVEKIKDDISKYLQAKDIQNRFIDENGNMVVHIHQEVDPDTSSDLRRVLKMVEPERWKELVEMAFSQIFGQIEVIDYKFEDIENYEENLNIKLELKVNSFARVENNVLEIDKLFDKVDLLKFYGKLQTRNLPLEVSSPVIFNQDVEISLPEGKIAGFQKRNEKIISSFGYYKLSMKKKKNRLFIRRNLFIPYQIVEKDYYKEFINFLNQIDSLENIKVKVFLKK